ncbi:MAG TPA: hypothetical protein VM327_00780 [Candidatus Thermoplasmatota archaeon]|nr:hypothetical protein [Candidatus Thermoplasmatota archaeon]
MVAARRRGRTDAGRMDARRSGRPARGARTRRSRSHGPRTVIPSNRWRPMRRVGGGPERDLEPGILGRLFPR